MRARTPGLVTLAVASALLLAACGDQPADDSAGPGAPQQPTGSVEPTEPEEGTQSVPPTSGTAPTSVVEQSVDLLSEQLGVQPSEIEVATAIEVTWRDGAIGCPDKGMGYTQALVPGALVELVVDGTTYAFHQGEGQPPFYCASPDPDEPLPES